MTTITVKVALSPVAMLTIASTKRITLNGLSRAPNNRAMTRGARSVANILGPCLSRAERAASPDSPAGLALGSRLGVFLIELNEGSKYKIKTREDAREDGGSGNAGKTC